LPSVGLFDGGFVCWRDKSKSNLVQFLKGFPWDNKHIGYVVMHVW